MTSPPKRTRVSKQIEPFEQDVQCSTAVTYTLPPDGKPFFSAYCACGWFGRSHRGRAAAFREGRHHSTDLDPEVHGLEARGVPDGARGISAAG
jgi:hypothetical protein